MAATVRQSGEAGLHIGIAAEAVLSAFVADQHELREVPPAMSRADARETFGDAAELLDEAGLSRALAPDEVPGEVRRRRAADPADLRGYAVDPVLAEWLEALSLQASGHFDARGGRRRPARAKGKKPKRSGKGRGRRG